MRSEEISVAPRQAAPVLLLTDAELAAISGGGSTSQVGHSHLVVES